MARFVLSLADVTDTDLALVGGKAFSLGFLTRHGFPVPNGFCVTAEASRAYAGRELDAGLVEEVASRIDEGKAYAVRSSAASEDSPESSFAGQHDTYLNVRGRDDILAAVRRCIASLHSDRTTAYRRERGIDEAGLAICVVIQEMVDSAKSGVVFTANPVTNNYNHLTIDAVRGLCEALVSGQKTPDFYCWHKRKRRIIERRAPGRVLEDTEAAALANVACEIEAAYGHPCDIEWAMDPGGGLHILQCRPITTLFPLVPGSALDADTIHYYLGVGYVQVMMQAMKPLGVSVFSEMVRDVGVDFSVDVSSWFTDVNGYLYVDATTFLKTPIGRWLIQFALPSLDLLMDDAMKAVLEKYPPQWAGLGPRTIGKSLGLFYKLVNGSASAYLSREKRPVGEELKRYMFSCRDDVRRRAGGCATAQERLALVRETLNAMPVTMFGGNGTSLLRIDRRKSRPHNLVAPAIPGVLCDTRLRRIMKRHDAVALVDGLESGLDGDINTEMNAQIGRIAAALAGDAEAVRIMKERPRDAHTLLKCDQIDQFIERFGSRGPGELDITASRYYEDFSPIARMVLSCMQDGSCPADTRAAARDRSKACEEEILRLTRNSRGVKGLIRNIRASLPIREYHKYFMTLIMAEVKRLIVAVAEDYAEAGILVNAKDVLYLTLDELRGATGLTAAVRERKAAYAANTVKAYPRIVTSEGERFDGRYNLRGVPEGALVGVPVSSGVYEGRVRHVSDPSRQSINKGEILLAVSADPGWTPLFVNAGAVVLEVGGMMTHGAIIAREYGIPLVAGVERATEKLHDGDRVRVDGGRGIVERLGSSDGG